MKILQSLCAAALTMLPAAAGAADLLPAMTSATDGGAVVKQPVSIGLRRTRAADD